jgi:hypothetical protein
LLIQVSSKNIVEKTITLSVICLFQTLQPCTSSAVLGHSKWIVEQVRKNVLGFGFGSTRLALYEGVKSLIEKFSKTKDDREYEADEDKRREAITREGAVFTATSAAALLDDNREGVESEDLRNARLHMALALVHSDIAHTLPRGELGSILKVWLEKERSRSIREPLHNAVLALELRERGEDISAIPARAGATRPGWN